MATDTGNDIESFVQEVRMPFVGSREYYLGHITVDDNNLLDLEEREIARFFVARRKCKRANGNYCYQLFSPSMYRSLRDECHAMTQDELDLVVMGQLRVLVHNDRMAQKTNARNKEHFCSATHNFISVAIVLLSAPIQGFWRLLL